jgi:hypothetical protein
MTQITWSIYNNRSGTTYTSTILSASYTYGRRGYLDNYPGGALAITIKNQSNEAAGFQINDQIDFIGYLGIYQAWYQRYWIAEIQYQDYPGNTGLSTATVVAVDAMARLGRVLGQGNILAAGTTGSQLDSMDTLSSWPPDIRTFANTTDSQASAATITASWNNQINLLQTTEKGIITWSYGRDIRMSGRSYVVNLRPSVPVALGRTANSSTIGYQTFNRYIAGQNFVNTAVIQPAGLSDVTGANSTSVTTYGQNGITQSTVDANATQAQGNADWTGNALSDPYSLRFEVGFTDRSQTQSTLLAFLQNVTGYGAQPYVITQLTYRVPGAGSDTTVEVVVEGFSVNVTPELSDWQFFLSPLAYYQFFTLDSATLGILDTSRLGW